jgi:hypothetical protein
MGRFTDFFGCESYFSPMAAGLFKKHSSIKNLKRKYSLRLPASRLFHIFPLNLFFFTCVA